MLRPNVPASLFALLLVLALHATAVRAEDHSHIETIVCGEHIQVSTKLLDLPPEGLQMRQPTLEKRAAQITLNAGPGLQANPDALDAWNRAVAIWESVLDDNVTIVIDGDLAALDPGVLGATLSSSFQAPYTTIRDAVAADRDLGTENFVANLPSAAQFSVEVPSGFSWSGNLSATKALLKALGFDMSGFEGPDAEITFSTGFEPDFDYDPADGITAGQFDFEAIVVHEIGHALGFTSTVDAADFLVSQGTTDALRPTVLDLFRLLPGQGSANFTSATRLVTTGDVQPTMAFWNGSEDRLLSTGVNLGDGRQASHWKANELTGTFIGIMDPTLSRGERAELEVDDLVAFGLIGWDTVLPAPITDCNGNGVDDADDIANGTAEDCNTNGIPDSCDIASGTSQDANGDGVPNECEVTSTVAPLRPSLEVSPNPFNPRTEVRFTLAAAGPARIDVYDVAGRHVATLADGSFEAGAHRIVWDGRNDQGRTTASGVYLVVLRGGEERLTRKVTLVE